MLIVKVWCLPQEDEDSLRALQQKMVQGLIEITELRVRTEEDVVILFPPDSMKYGLGSEIFIEVQFTSCFSNPMIYRQTGDTLLKIIEEKYDKASVGCLVHPFDGKGPIYCSSRQ